MDDKENSMALNSQSMKGQKRHNIGLSMQATLPKQPRWRQIIVRIGCSVMILLIGAMIAQRIWAFQMKQLMNTMEKARVLQEPTTKVTENKSDLKNFVSRLRHVLCRPLHTGLVDNSTCKLCPQNWLFYEDKCYWISKGKGSWKKSKEDCTARSSQMLVMQKQKDMAFIQLINEGMQLLWIGLQATFPEQKWTWVDGSPLEDKQSQELGPVERNSCGMLNGNEIISEACSTIAAWVCETESLDISNNKM
ncbi:killer cell lectin-like receptor subfamily B member 1B allele C [Eublepharis macularius]|uniref:Killer cell lectin-like receptor subfamily B member 1B allele C n=1 Tax=Eublepharis macularius TaxID=481883 RepID=A0AA97KWW6_EUBMA|nr:killer cell lectin-like receptor subfamily B member 1B allele C [Eublepharis macularius]